MNRTPNDAASSVHQRAGLYVVAVGLVELLFCGLFAAVLWSVWAGWIPLPQLDQQQVEAIRQQVLARSVAVTLLGVGPAVIYLTIVPAVQRGVRTASMLALILALTQSIVLLWLLVRTIVSALQALDPVRVTFSILCLGTLLTLLAALIHQLLRSRSLGAAAQQSPTS